MRSLVLRFSVSVLGVSALLLLLVSLLVPVAPARSSSPPGDVPDRSGIITDTRWLELIRSGGPRSPLNRATAALPTLNLHLTDNLIAGYASSPASITLVVWRDNAIIVNTSTRPYPDDQGYFYIMQFYPSYDYYATLQPGDVISLTQAGASLTLTVPVLTAQVDAQTDRVSGAAPISDMVTTYLYSFADGSGPYTQTVAADAGGHYQADYAGTLDVRPRDNGYVAHSAAPGRTIYLRSVAPFLRVQVGGEEISGMAAPRSSIVITAANANGTPYFSWNGSTASNGAFNCSYCGESFKPGDRITATSAGQIFSMTVLTLTAQIDLTNQQVRGEAPVAQAVEVRRFGGPLNYSTDSLWNETPLEQVVVTATAAGQYTATLALARPNYGAAIITTSDGYQIYARFVAPYLTARMGNVLWLPYQVSGQIDDATTVATITIQGPSGYLKDVHSVYVTSNGYFADYAANNLFLDTGDVITVATARGVQASLRLPVLTGQIDPEMDTVFGTAPPGARLTLTLNSFGPPASSPSPASTLYAITGGGMPPASPYTVIVTATAQGDYLINLHGILDLYSSSLAEIGLTTAEGNGVTRGLTTAQDCLYPPTMVYIGGNQVNFSLSQPMCATTYTRFVRLRAADGRLKSEQVLPGGLNYSSVYFYTGAQPVSIDPGDHIEIEGPALPRVVSAPTQTLGPMLVVPRPAYRGSATNHLITIVVPTMTVQLDKAADVISGQAPPSTTVEINLYRDQRPLGTFTAPVDAQGFYTVSLASGPDMEAGDVARLTYTPLQPPAFSALGVLPALRVQLYQANVEGVLPPLTAFTATLETTATIAAVYQGIATNEGSFSAWLVPIQPNATIVVTTAQQVLRLKMPYLTAHIDRNSATVFGEAPSLAPLRVALYGDYSFTQDVTATANGTYSATFPNLAPLNTASGKLTYFDPEGDQAILPFAIVRWDVIIDNPCWSGNVDAGGAPVTATLRDTSGGLKSMVVFTPTSALYYACFTTTIQSGDQIALQSLAATEVFTIPVLSARYNNAIQAVEGAAPPNHDLNLEAWWNTTIRRRTYSDGNGRYGVDTSDLHPPLRSPGRVYLYDEAGNTTSAYFTVTGYQTFLPILRR